MVNTRIHFAQELAEVDESLLRMGAVVRSMVADAVDAILESDMLPVQKVLDDDDLVDAIEDQIEANCLRLLALQQPMARDLRRIVSAIKVATELERVGDCAVEIAKCARKIHRECFIWRPLVDLAPMSSAAERMLDESLCAFVRRDIDAVKRICEEDDFVDAAYKRLRSELIRLSEADTSSVPAATYMLLVIAALERIADHASDIAERVAFLETGEIHKFSREHRLGQTPGVV